MGCLAAVDVVVDPGAETSSKPLDDGEHSRYLSSNMLCSSLLVHGFMLCAVNTHVFDIVVDLPLSSDCPQYRGARQQQTGTILALLDGLELLEDRGNRSTLLRGISTLTAPTAG